jgi:hypothetical protein
MKEIFINITLSVVWLVVAVYFYGISDHNAFKSSKLIKIICFIFIGFCFLASVAVWF